MPIKGYYPVIAQKINKAKKKEEPKTEKSVQKKVTKKVTASKQTSSEKARHKNSAVLSNAVAQKRSMTSGSKNKFSYTAAAKTARSNPFDNEQSKRFSYSTRNTDGRRLGNRGERAATGILATKVAPNTNTKGDKGRTPEEMARKNATRSRRQDALVKASMQSTGDAFRSKAANAASFISMAGEGRTTYGGGIAGGNPLKGTNRITYENKKDPLMEFSKKQNEVMAQHRDEAQKAGVGNAYDVNLAASTLATDLPLMFVGGKELKATKGLSKLGALKTMLSNSAKMPLTYAHGMDYTGQRYSEALSEGATKQQAMLSALSYGPAMAFLENTGGTEAVVPFLRAGMKSGVLASVLRGAGTEAIENTLQEPFSMLTKTNYKDIPLFSNDENEDAWINPKRTIKNAAIGALLGGAFSGGITGVNNRMSGKPTKAKTEQIPTRENLETVADEMVRAGEVTREEADRMIPAAENIIREAVQRRKTAIEQETAEKQGREMPVNRQNDYTEPFMGKEDYNGENDYTSALDENTENIDENTGDITENTVNSDLSVDEKLKSLAPVGKVVSKHAISAWKSTNDEMQRSLIEKAIADGEVGYTHDVYSDKAAQEKVGLRIEKDGVDNFMLEEVAKASDRNNGKIKFGEAFANARNIHYKDDVTAGIAAYVEALNSGDYETANILLRSNAALGTELGRGVQAYSQLRKLSPEGRIYHNQIQLSREWKNKQKFDPTAVKSDVEGSISEALPNIINEALATIKEENRKPKAAPKTENEKLNNRIKQIIRQGIKDEEINLNELAKQGRADEVCLTLTKYALNKAGYNLDNASVLDVYSAIWSNIGEKVKSYRESIIKRMLASVDGGNRRAKREYLKKLIELNNLGGFDDTETANMVYESLNIPVVSPEEMEYAMRLAKAAQTLDQNPETPINALDLDPEDEKTIRDITRVKAKYGAEHAADVLYKMSDDVFADKVKTNNWQKARQLQLVSMLGNAKTQMRNITPNIAMAGMNTTGDFFGAGLDRVLAKKTGVRTKGLPDNPVSFGKNMAKGVGMAFEDLYLGIDTSTGNRFDMSQRHAFSDNNKVGKALNAASDITFATMSAGDRSFETAYYENSLKRQMELNKVDKASEEMEEIAMIEAMERTFKDSNAATNTMNSVIRMMNGGKDFGIGSVFMPFVKTPMNLAKAMIQYTPPTGTIQLISDAVKLRNAEADEKVIAQHKLVNDFSKLASGTLLTALVIALSKLGLVTFHGAGDDNADREKYNEEVYGFKPYSIEINGKYYAYSDLLPIGGSIAFATMLNERLNEKSDENFLLGLGNDIVNATGDELNLLASLTFMQTFKKIKFDDLGNSILSIFQDAPQQFIPQVVNQLAQVLDPVKRDTADELWYKEMFNKVIARIPGLSKTLPAKYDSFGNPIERYDGGTGTDILNAFINPFTVTMDKSTSVTDEINALEQSTGEKLIPTHAPNTIEIGQETYKLTAADKSKWDKTVGGSYNEAIKELMNSTEYANMNSDEKAGAINAIYNALKGVYKNEMLNDKGFVVPLSTQYKKYKLAEEQGISFAKHAAINTMVKQIDDMYGENDARPSRKRALIMLNSGLTEEQQLYELKANNLISETAVGKAADGKATVGLSEYDYIKAWAQLNYLDETLGKDADKVAEAIKFIYRLNFTAEQKAFIYDTAVDDTIHRSNKKIPDFSGSEIEAILSMEGETKSASWDNGNKYYATPTKELFDDYATYQWAYNYMNKADSAKKVDLVAKLDELDLTVNQKKAILSSRNVSLKNVSFHDGGSVPVQKSTTIEGMGDFFSDLANNKDKKAVAKPKEGANTQRTAAEMSIKKAIDEVGKYDFNTYAPMGTDFARTGKYGESRPGHTHAGIDLGVRPRGAEAKATAMESGTIKKLGARGDYGNAVEIEFPDGSSLLYGHLASINSDLKQGDKVAAGTPLGIVGNTGNSTGVHLHLELRDKNGKSINPESRYNFHFDKDGLSTGMSKAKDSGEYTGTAYASSSGSSGSSGSTGSSGGSSGGGSGHSGGGGSGGTLARRIAHKSGGRYGYSSGAGYGYNGKKYSNFQYGKK